jgi:hypothetical protein
MYKITRSELRYKREIATDELSMPGHHDAASLSDWQATSDDITAALDADDLTGHKLAAEELFDDITSDACDDNEKRQITADLARSGHMADSIYNPNWISTHKKPARCTVDGVVYERPW